MNICINNQCQEVSASNLQQLADLLQLPAKGVAVAVNNQMVTRTLWTETLLKENDRITIIKAACGG